MTDDGVLLETTELTKEFGGFRAVDGVDLQVRAGDIHALIGPNGAGKTTLFNLMTGFLAPTRGEIRFRGEVISGFSPQRLAGMGLVRSFQITAIFDSMSVIDNIRLALQRKLGVSLKFWRSRRILSQLDGRAMEILDLVGLAGLADEASGSLPYGRKRALELATTLAMDPALMLLDEPTQGMGHEDVDHVTRLIKEVAQGRTVLMVEHNMSVVSTISNTLSVLQGGRLIASGSYADVSRDPAVISAYLGTSARKSGALA